MKLAIISHTEHFKDTDGNIVGWGPTVREINYLADHFDYIYHLACFYDISAPVSALPYTKDNIEFVPLPSFGGKSLLDKFSVISTAPKIIKKINSILQKVDAVQLRLPTGMGYYLMPYFTLKNPKGKLWVKYAGNWMDEEGPMGYQFQKWWLKMNFLNCPVTINGKWANQPKHCLSFENPCIDEQEQIVGAQLLQTKQYGGPLTGIFIGRLESWKGVDRIVEVLPELANKGVAIFHFVGGGGKLDQYKEIVEKMNLPIKVVFHDYLKRETISILLSQSHLLLLPSDSEGFPKVVAEAANYGCVAIVSNVSSIPHYINEKNGFLWDSKLTSFMEFIKTIDIGSVQLSMKAKNAFEMSKLFTFERNNNNILKLLK